MSLAEIKLALLTASLTGLGLIFGYGFATSAPKCESVNPPCEALSEQNYVRLLHLCSSYYDSDAFTADQWWASCKIMIRSEFCQP